MFTASMVAGSVFMILNNLVQDNPFIDSEYNLSNCNTVMQSALFKAICSIKNYNPIYKYISTQSKLVFISSFWNLLAYVFIGAVFGLLSAAYIALQSKLRAKLQPVMQRNRYLLPIIVAIISGLLTFPGFTEFLSYMPKRSMQDLLLARPLDSPTNSTLDLIAHANDWASTGSVIGSLAVYFVVKLILLAFAIVLPIPCGFLGPIMTLGAAGGRFFGEIFLMWGWISPSVRPEAFAIAGAAAFATGISRALVTPLLFFEMTGQINQPFSVFVAVITSYLVGDKLSMSMYDTLGVIGSTFSLRQFKRSSGFSGQSSTVPLACPVYMGARQTDVIALPQTCRRLSTFPRPHATYFSTHSTDQDDQHSARAQFLYAPAPTQLQQHFETMYHAQRERHLIIQQVLISSFQLLIRWKTCSSSLLLHGISLPCISSDF
jgi:hypothetical protein